jgi:hypothetical protein
MFSFYEGKINNNTPSKTIDFNTLINITRTNPYNRDYKTIRDHKKGDKEYSQGKKDLVRCQPNCVVKYNSISGSDFDKNYETGSGYIYLDIDNIENPLEFKKEFISKYKEVVSMVCISSGGGGLSILVKINHTITSKEEYKSIIDYLSSHYFEDIELDKRALKLSQMWFISYDPDVYVNLEVCIDVREGLKCVSQGIIQGGGGSNTLFYAPEGEIMYLSITEIDTNLITKTKYINKSDIDIDTIPWTDIKIPRNIGDGYKRKLFTYYFHALFNLNPEIDPKWIFAYVYNINRNCADPRMSYRDLLSLFNMQYGYIKSDQYNYQNNRKKSLHINPKLNLSGGQKSLVANKVNGSIRKNKTKLKIAVAIKQLKKENEKHTISSISRLSGVSRKTVGCHMKDLELIDLDALINQLMENIK